jgi:cellulose biosynthesis protein BcsQ
MEQNTKKRGQVITFYSYKGGTGRSMALANEAVLMAQSGKRVLMLDWDLEAPGLTKYFFPFIPKNAAKNGLIDFFIMADEALPEVPFESQEEMLFQELFIKLQDYLITLQGVDKISDNLFLIKAGDERSDRYAEQISNFDWVAFFKKRPSFFYQMALWLSETFDYVLIDSRTGHTDTGGICTIQMPDKLVLVFTPNNQSYEGISRLAQKAVELRKHSHDLRPLMVYTLPSRIELNEDQLRENWLIKYNKDLKQLYQTLYNLPEQISLDNYVNNIQVRHASRYAYEEKIAVLEEAVADTNSLTKSYQNFNDILEERRAVWNVNLEDNQNQHKRIKLFISYSPKDYDYMVSLEKHLAPLVYSDKVNIVNIENFTGSNLSYEEWLLKEIDSADIILPLISPDYLYSKGITDIELPAIFKKGELQIQHIVPIILKYCLWQETDFSKFNVLPTYGEPIESSKWVNKDQALYHVVSTLSNLIKNLYARNH